MKQNLMNRRELLRNATTAGALLPGLSMVPGMAPEKNVAAEPPEKNGSPCTGVPQCEYLDDPLGVDVAAPRFSWTMEGPDGTFVPLGKKQLAYQILVATDPRLLTDENPDMWDSGVVKSDRMTQIPYEGAPLSSATRYHWILKLWNEQETMFTSEPRTFVTGLLKPDDWTADWISFRDETPLHSDRESLYLPPAREYRKTFSLKKNVRQALLFASALGNYDMYVNGERIHESVFLPGWADYLKRNYYQTFDVTERLREGGNAIGAVVVDGWYSGYVGYGLLCGYGPNRTGRYFYGKTPAMIAQLIVEYEDGSKETIVSDTSWKVSDDGPVREADIIMGEAYDARMERPDWCTYGYDDTGWENAITAQENGSTKAIFSDNKGDREVELGFQKPARMQSYMAPPISAATMTEKERAWGIQKEFLGEIPAVRKYEYQSGVWIYDLGQEFAGVARLRFRGPAGTKVQIRYGEMVHPDGRLMTENLRRARATDYYTLRGDPGGEVWTPRFTYHGFRYVEITGLTDEPADDAVVGIPWNSRTPLRSTFECSSPMVNRLFRNIVWTQLANFVEVPTDCPQRDERLGWMGDAQAYIRTASYNADVAAFFTKWFDDLVEAQLGNGAYPDYAPYPMSHGGAGLSWGTAWTDAGIICPWTILMVYADTRLIAKHYDSFAKFIDFRVKSSPDLRGVSLGNSWGDWLSLNESTPIEYVDICFFANSARKMADMADAIGKTADATKYRKLYRDICAVHNAEYLNEDGTLKVDTQTAYVLALDFEMIPRNLVAASAQRLVDKIREMDTRMTTGFLGTKSILSVLTRTGHQDVAMELFLSTKLPSWGFEVENGATTIWERWDSYSKEDGGAKHIGMNSFSHYAFGAVCEWMFRYLAGIDMASDTMGYRLLFMAPEPGTGGTATLDYVTAEFLAPSGFVRSEWKVEKNDDG
ncbi:MAG: family 78 glycoside hydrolase catalytic domain, partial [Planctomycetia bacterium]|nr:family 78 glycoside hydrolase catalytic domain [Planctomycetia bacterium]